MKVALKRDWFYEGQLFEKSEKATEVPDEFKPHLPKDATVIDSADYVSADPAGVLTTLQDFDHERQATDVNTAFKGKAQKK